VVIGFGAEKTIKHDFFTELIFWQTFIARYYFFEKTLKIKK
jgi:hypothetical protein